MRYNFCTLFDRNYVYKGLTLYNSLLRHCPEFTLWILCMDDLTLKIMKKLDLEKAILIKLSDFEDDDLKEVKPTRTIAEYCWTCTPSLPLYILRQVPSLDHMTYLDADLFFYGSPKPIYEEFEDRSIMIIEHRFPNHLRHLEVNGIYNVQMLIFRNDKSALECLHWWRDRCNEWCYYRLEDGKMGDQKYLDDWTTRFKGVHVLQYKGAGVALWNITRYTIAKKDGIIFIDDVPLVFYHFHQFSLLRFGSYDFGEGGHYTLTSEDIELIYRPYIHALEESIQLVKSEDRKFNYGYKFIKKDSFFDKVRNFPSRVKRKLGYIMRKGKMA